MASKNEEHEITDLLLAWNAGEPEALDRLTPLVYSQLERLAASMLRQEPSGRTLQTSDLLHEAFLRLVQQDRVSWRNRAQFFAIAGRMMRRILVDAARSRGYRKRGGGSERVDVEVLDQVALPERDTELVALDDALVALAKENPELVEIVELKYFSGLTLEEMSEVTGKATATLHRRWRLARAWLHQQLGAG